MKILIDKETVELALDALGEIALAGMSGTGQESDEAMTEWHARQAWKFIGIAARQLDSLRQALEQSTEQEPVAFITPLMEQQMFDDWCPYKGNPDPRTVWAAAIDAANGLLLGASPPQPQEAAPRKQLRRGDVLRCIETDELCFVWSTSTTGKTLVKWGPNNFGEYTAEQIGELFWLEQEPDDLELAAEKSDNYAAFHAGYRFAIARTTPPQPQEDAPRQWVGLTDDERLQIYLKSNGIEFYKNFAMNIEAKLKEKNTRNGGCL